MRDPANAFPSNEEGANKVNERRGACWSKCGKTEKGRLSRERRNLRYDFGEHYGHHQYRLHYKQIYSFYPIDIFVSDSFKTTEWRAWREHRRWTG